MSKQRMNDDSDIHYLMEWAYLQELKLVTYGAVAKQFN